MVQRAQKSLKIGIYGFRQLAHSITYFLFHLFVCNQPQQTTGKEPVLSLGIKMPCLSQGALKCNSNQIYHHPESIICHLWGTGKYIAQIN